MIPEQNRKIAEDAQLSNGQIERLLVIAEECAEVSQCISKILRFGPENYHPRTKETNIDRFREEMTDLIAMYNLSLHAGDFDPITEQEVLMSQERKLGYMLHQGEE